MITLTAGIPEPLSRSAASQRPTLRVALVQHRWRPDAGELAAVLRDGINRAAGEGATAVFLPEITLMRYPADTPAGPNPGAEAEDLNGGPTFALAAEAAVANGINSGLFMVVPNRTGNEGELSFYGSSFISAPVDTARPYGDGHPATAVVK